MSREDLTRRAKLSNQLLTSAKYLKSNLTIYTVLRITKALDCTIGDLIYDLITHKDVKCTSLLEDADTCEISVLAPMLTISTRRAL